MSTGPAGCPGFVPPGHGLLYLGALALGRSDWVQERLTTVVRVTAAAVTAYALWGLSPLAPRLDVLGALWAGCLLWFLARGRNPGVYAGAFVVVTWLEWIGTGLGTWAWAPSSPTGLIAQGNPPSGAAGGYCFFDAAALLLAPMLLRLLRQVRWLAGTAAARGECTVAPEKRVERVQPDATVQAEITVITEIVGRARASESPAAERRWRERWGDRDPGDVLHEEMGLP